MALVLLCTHFGRKTTDFSKPKQGPWTEAAHMPPIHAVTLWCQVLQVGPGVSVLMGGTYQDDMGVEGGTPVSFPTLVSCHLLGTSVSLPMLGACRH